MLELLRLCSQMLEPRAAALLSDSATSAHSFCLFGTVEIYTSNDVLRQKGIGTFSFVRCFYCTIGKKCCALTNAILTEGSNPDRGMRLNLPIAIVPLRRTDNGYWIFQPTAAYSGDEQMCILGRGHASPTVTALISVRAQCFTNCAIKAICFYSTIGKTLRSHTFMMMYLI